MNPLQTEFLAHDRIANLRREANAPTAPSIAESRRPLWPPHVDAVRSRVAGRLRIAFRLVDA